MSQLVRFKEFAATANTAPATSYAHEASILPTIEQLRLRLVSRNCADSLDVRVAIVGELTYLCFKELAKKRYL